MPGEDVRWVVRLTPPPGRTVADLLLVRVALDVWQREQEALVAAVSDTVLDELERRRLATVERLCTASEYEERASRLAALDPTAGQ